MSGKNFPINTMAGIRKDGTPYAGNYYIDGQHCRFQRGVPQKMGGRVEMVGDLQYPSRGIYVNPAVSYGQMALFNGDQNTLTEYFFDLADGDINYPGAFDRTPIGFKTDANNLWSFDVIYSSIAQTSYIFAHAAPNAGDINSTVETPVYYGLLSSGGIDNTDKLIPIPTPANGIGAAVSGGILALHPFLVTYGNDGMVSFTADNDPTKIVNSQSICSQKIVAALQTRAGNAAPGALFWSLDTLIRAYFSPINGIPNFKFDTISDQTSIISQNAAIEYDGLYMWVCVDRFCFFNGTAVEVPNDMNINWFFDNINYSQRQKVWITKYPRKGEIWVHFPFGNSTECNEVVIFNKRENKWYNTRSLRGAGYFEQIYPYPIWATNTPDGGGKYSIFTHEKGLDEVLLNGTINPIQSYFETGDISFCALGPSGTWTGVNRWVALNQIEYDFIQTGPMTLSVRGREYSRGDLTIFPSITFMPETTRDTPRMQLRHMTLRFESNVIGGYYEMGQPILNLSIGDARS